MSIIITTEQEALLKELLDNLYFSSPCYWKLVDNKPRRIKARGFISDILGILPKKAKAFLASQNIEKKQMPRPVRVPRVKKDKPAAAAVGVKELKEKGKSQRETAAILGVGVGTVNRDLDSVPNGTEEANSKGSTVPNGMPDPVKAVEKEIAAYEREHQEPKQTKKKTGPKPDNKKRLEKIADNIENRFSLIYRGKYVGIWDEYNGVIRQLFRSKEEALQELELMKADQIEYNDVPGWGASKARNGSYE
jgi:hypothetical protein